MNSNFLNFAAQNQKVPYPNYRPGPTTNSIQAPMKNFNQIIPQYGSPQPINMNPVPSGYNPVNIRPP